MEPCSLTPLPTSHPPSDQWTAMLGGYWSLHNTKKSRVRNAHRGAAARTENYRYRNARLGTVSGKCVKMFGPGTGRRRCTVRTSLFVLKMPVTRFLCGGRGRGLVREGDEERAEVLLEPRRLSWREDFSADNDLSCTPSWPVQNQLPSRVHCTFPFVNNLVFFPDPGCHREHAVVPPSPLKPLLQFDHLKLHFFH